MPFNNPTYEKNDLNQLTELIHQVYKNGWAPATSTNYSIRTEKTRAFITRSGVDKSNISPSDFVKINLQGQIVSFDRKAKTSAETALHTSIYRLFPDVHCILHTHSVANTVLSKYYAYTQFILFKGWEVQKAISGTNLPIDNIRLPIFENHQNIEALAHKVENHFHNNPNFYGYLIEGHGLYVWGKTIDDAKRHLEAYEFLLTCVLNTLFLPKAVNGNDWHS